MLKCIKLVEQYGFLPNNLYLCADGTVSSRDGVIERLIPIDYNNNGKANINFTSSKGKFICWIAPTIWTLFVGKIPTGFEITHKNGNKADCRLENLKLQPKGGGGFDEYKLVEPHHG